jgi:hypothetical protein
MAAYAVPQLNELRTRTRLTHLHPGATCSIVNTMASTAKVARVAVSDEEWRAFRQAGLAQGISVSTYLARLVEAELKRRRGRPVDAVDPEAAPADQAVNALAEVRVSIDELDKIAPFGALRHCPRRILGGHR